MLNECLDWQPSQIINIVGKDNFIQQCSYLAGLRGCHIVIVIEYLYHLRKFFITQ
jgi:hypothetical protein